MSDPWFSLIILAFCVLGWWLFLVWDQRMEQRARRKLDAEVAQLKKRVAPPFGQERNEEK
jgi:hypothetical protein